ncbi:putative membrane protein, partial [Chlamydia psittaci 02DC22]
MEVSFDSSEVVALAYCVFIFLIIF